MNNDDSEQLAGLGAPRTLTRKERREMMLKQQKRRRRRRRARLRRVKAWRALRSLQFWTRTAIALVLLLLFAFWARFAYVYDIPSYAASVLPPHIRAYVTVKPWWFGPPVFDLGLYAPDVGGGAIPDPYAVLLYKLGQYAPILTHPQIIWVSH
ncbi:hypothetical protein C7445_11535 [Alicyclobacillus sacchari]|uniref:Uncharacterized protein n=1 Tax=Alicyclobacillus sacchari TaxID=392010 RepID=A0A4R8LGX4_9BACL|nr:hypothetical protein [Alicyclobacillus sacchari]TDY42404.1 hypothetical protein C7445_11535 [Alicyclobacillus sacchari]GMA57342.1 hypothetical protein GCM10025858_18450 [Alicyclobacillus sacchari]